MAGSGLELRPFSGGRKRRQPASLGVGGVREAGKGEVQRRDLGGQQCPGEA